MTKLPLVSSAVIFLFSLGQAHAVHANDAMPAMAQADAAYMQREDLTQDTLAVDLYERIGAVSSSVEAYWKASRAAWWLGEHAEKRADKLASYQRGIDDANKALALQPDCAEAHFWLGGNLGSFGDAKGVLKSLSLVKPIRHEMAEVIRLNDRYNGGAAYHVLGVVDYKVPGMMGGNKARAKQELEKALSIDPNDPFHHFYMAEYAKLTGDKARFQSELATLNSLTPPSDLIPEANMLRARAAREFK